MDFIEKLGALCCGKDLTKEECDDVKKIIIPMLVCSGEAFNEDSP